MNNLQHREYDETLGLTSQTAVAAVGNRYDLILVASRRVRELSRGDTPLINCRRGATLTALKEIEFGKVGRSYLYKEQNLDSKRRKRLDR